MLKTKVFHQKNNSLFSLGKKKILNFFWGEKFNISENNIKMLNFSPKNISKNLIIFYKFEIIIIIS
jgi:hypothetical protein